jgi:hypothetical protein
MQRGQVVLVDTNIIIEAVRTGCWNALTAHFSMQTVEKCCEEARTGEAHRRGYVEVSEKILREDIRAYPVSTTELAQLDLRDAEAFRLDDGERQLWAHALGRSDAWIASCCDQAAVNVAVRLGWEDRLVSLEELVTAVGARHAVRELKQQFASSRLSAWRTAALLKRGLK